MQLYQSGFSVSFDRLVISCTKSVFSTQFYRPNKKTAKIWCFAPTSLFYIIHCWSSIWAYLFIIICLNIIKSFHLINSLSATTAPCFWAMHLLALLKMSLRIFFKKCSVNSTLFVASDAVLNFYNKPSLYKRLLFLKVHSQAWDNFWQLKAL